MLELASHLEQKAAQLKHEGLGQIKMALASTDTSSLLGILQAHFGHVASSECEEEDVLVEAEKNSGTREEVIVRPKEVGSLATAELVFPFKSSTPVIAGIPKNYLPLHGPKTQSCCHCQFPHVT